jgi:hypothetical protein
MGSHNTYMLCINIHYVYQCCISITLVEYKILLKLSLKQSCKVIKIMRTVLCVLLWYCFTVDLYKLRKYMWLVVLDRDNIPCSWVLCWRSSE